MIDSTIVQRMSPQERDAAIDGLRILMRAHVDHVALRLLDQVLQSLEGLDGRREAAVSFNRVPFALTPVHPRALDGLVPFSSPAVEDLKKAALGAPAWTARVRALLNEIAETERISLGESTHEGFSDPMEV